jgi:hypothetical protein
MYGTAAVLAAGALGAGGTRLPPRLHRLAWLTPFVAMAVSLPGLTRQPVPPPIVSPDLYAAGRWARDHLDVGCVGYLVENAEVAYWLHLAVLGQPRSSPRTADIDGYTANRELGRWIAGVPQTHAIARASLLPGEVLADTVVVFREGDAVVLATDRPQMSGCR